MNQILADYLGRYANHRQFRKLTKTKGAFPNENSLLKLLYLG
ncbi:ISSod4 transposase, TnpA_ISSod4_50 [Yersinia enterocolitica subsp. palearctica 105.5R(r)]|uniref:ISsod5, transposase n=1 Tax=Yersinia enterocolitica subsp. palearctica serotype O:3 (strain DSM 13030 / CIP 106945 / Y11) TaxID=930944 RepID=A0A0H3NR21_YERE1|nr:ISSod4 transposase, TnpA_ISSod4_50 [Yersinia enterocolitica subsp. palearctica 105.5R(r)]CBY27608.1 ISsod5, transposase [Yersinia enterocolitica subsp. palearctica Y11]CCO69022.1 ISSod5, transposase [Yersinia enterocolitica IP 10393]